VAVVVGGMPWLGSGAADGPSMFVFLFSWWPEFLDVVGGGIGFGRVLGRCLCLSGGCVLGRPGMVIVGWVGWVFFWY